MRGWSITRCAFAACKHAHATLAALTPCAPVAQRLEQQTHNLLVRGSNPCGGTRVISHRFCTSSRTRNPLRGPSHRSRIRSQEPTIDKHTDSNSGGGECSIVFHPMFGDFPA